MADREAIAIVELNGLPTAIAFADTAVKAANIKLIGYELSKGEGLVTVKFNGNVGAIKAAVDAGSAVATKLGGVYGKLIIPRPSKSLEKMIRNKETVGYQEFVCSELTDCDLVNSAQISNGVLEIDGEILIDEKDYPINIDEKPLGREVTCNLCHNPECTRKKGEPRSSCIEYSTEKNKQ